MRRHFTAPIPTTITPDESAALGRLRRAWQSPAAEDLAVLAELHRRLPPRWELCPYSGSETIQRALAASPGATPSEKVRR